MSIKYSDVIDLSTIHCLEFDQISIFVKQNKSSFIHETLTAFRNIFFMIRKYGPISSFTPSFLYTQFPYANAMAWISFVISNSAIGCRKKRIPLKNTKKRNISLKSVCFRVINHSENDIYHRNVCILYPFIREIINLNGTKLQLFTISMNGNVPR